MVSVPLDPWQYRLSKDETSESLAVGPLWLSVGPELPVIMVTDSAGLSVGILLGFPIDLNGRCMIRGTWQAPVRAEADLDAFSQGMLRSLGGRFLWIQTAGGQHRIYPDCSAQVTCVYDPAACMAGSTAHALLDEGDYDRRFDGESFDRLGIDGEGWFPAGLTAHHGIHRLLPSHCLHLDTWQVRRFWPESRLRVVLEPSAAVDEIIDIIRRQLEAVIAGPKRLALALTAGRETRMLLACARPYLNDVDFITVSGGDRHEIDTVMARCIARDLGLNHVGLPRAVATDAQRQEFIRRGGHCNADSNSRYHPSIWPIGQSHILMGGVGGEVARAFFWRSSDTANSSVSPQVMANRFGLPVTAPLLEAIGRWQEGLPAMDTREMLDLAYLEHRDGAWYAAQFCCDPTLLRIAPLLTIRVVELMMQLPPDWKLANRLGHAIIEKLWPELERYPYNSLGRWKDMMVKVQRVVADPRIILKKLRKVRS